MFSAPISFIFSNFISLFLNVLSHTFLKCSRKAFVYIYVSNMYNIYILENMTFCLKLYDILILFAWLSMNRMLDF